MQQELGMQETPSRATQESQAGLAGLHMQRCARQGTSLARKFWSELAFFE